MSSAHESALTGHHQTSYANTSDGPITEAQQIAQHYAQETAEIDPDLGQLIEAWPTPPPLARGVTPIIAWSGDGEMTAT